MADQQTINEFKGCNDDSIAKSFLEASKGDLSDAVTAFFESPSSSSKPTDAGSKGKQPASQGSSGNKMKTLADMLSGEGEKKGENLYAGGEKSGIAVQSRGGDRAKELVENIMEKAAKEGQEFAEDDKPKRFQGRGFTLGSDNADSQVVEAETQEEVVTRTLTFWQDGFSVEDGPLMRYDDPQNQEVLNAIRSGRAPISLLNVKPNQRVDARIVQRMEEKYTPPAIKPVSSFTGQGNRLGGITSAPNTSTSSSVPGGFPSTSGKSEEKKTTSQANLVSVDSSQPVTSIQIRLGDGTRLVARFNHTHTVGDLRSFVSSAQAQSRPFVLQTPMPVKVFDDDSKSLKDAQLLNAVVVQRFI